MVNKEDLKLLKELSTLAGPTVEVGYFETTINKNCENRCWAVGRLKKVNDIFIERNVVLAPITKGTVVCTTEEIHFGEETPLLITIPLDAIFCVKRLVREKPVCEAIDFPKKRKRR